MLLMKYPLSDAQADAQDAAGATPLQLAPDGFATGEFTVRLLEATCRMQTPTAGTTPTPATSPAPSVGIRSAAQSNLAWYQEQQRRRQRLLAMDRGPDLQLGCGRGTN